MSPWHASRPFSAALAGVVLAGCGMFLGDGQAPGQMLADGRILIGRGELNGQEWVATAARRGNEVCIVYGGALSQMSGSCTSNEQGGGSMSASSDDRLTQLEGFSDPRAAGARVETAAGILEVPAVALDRLGVQATAFAVVLPANIGISRLLILDANGQIVESFEIGLRP